MSEWSKATVDKYWAECDVLAEGEPMGFSWHRCCSCGGLAGDRYTVSYRLPEAIAAEEEARQASLAMGGYRDATPEERAAVYEHAADVGGWQSATVCPDCLMYIANAEVPDGCEG